MTMLESAQVATMCFYMIFLLFSPSLKGGEKKEKKKRKEKKNPIFWVSQLKHRV